MKVKIWFIITGLIFVAPILASIFFLPRTYRHTGTAIFTDNESLATFKYQITSKSVLSIDKLTELNTSYPVIVNYDIRFTVPYKLTPQDNVDTILNNDWLMLSLVCLIPMAIGINNYIDENS